MLCHHLQTFRKDKDWQLVLTRIEQDTLHFRENEQGKWILTPGVLATNPKCHFEILELRQGRALHGAIAK
jgi:hypothetical protein